MSNSVNSVYSVNSVSSFNSYSAVLPPSPMVFFWCTHLCPNEFRLISVWVVLHLLHRVSLCIKVNQLPPPLVDLFLKREKLSGAFTNLTRISLGNWPYHYCYYHHFQYSYYEIHLYLRNAYHSSPFFSSSVRAFKSWIEFPFSPSSQYLYPPVAFGQLTLILIGLPNPPPPHPPHPHVNPHVFTGLGTASIWPTDLQNTHDKISQDTILIFSNMASTIFSGTYT